MTTWQERDEQVLSWNQRFKERYPVLSEGLEELGFHSPGEILDDLTLSGGAITAMNDGGGMDFITSFTCWPGCEDDDEEREYDDFYARGAREDLADDLIAGLIKNYGEGLRGFKAWRLTHGTPDSTQLWHDIAATLATQGYILHNGDTNFEIYGQLSDEAVAQWHAYKVEVAQMTDLVADGLGREDALLDPCEECGAEINQCSVKGCTGMAYKVLDYAEREEVTGQEFGGEYYLCENHSDAWRPRAHLDANGESTEAYADVDEPDWVVMYSPGPDGCACDAWL